MFVLQCEPQHSHNSLWAARSPGNLKQPSLLPALFLPVREYYLTKKQNLATVPLKPPAVSFTPISWPWRDIFSNLSLYKEIQIPKLIKSGECWVSWDRSSQNRKELERRGKCLWLYPTRECPLSMETGEKKHWYTPCPAGAQCVLERVTVLTLWASVSPPTS